MVKSPPPAHPALPATVQVPVTTPSLSTFVLMLIDPVNEVLVRVSVLPPEVTVIVSVLLIS
jgi:hypothetical protein